MAWFGYMYIFVLILKYIVAKWYFKMNSRDLYEAMQKDGAFFTIKSPLE